VLAAIAGVLTVSGPGLLLGARSGSPE
jgi:hypothetical protein